jgi:hypothetical protein
MSLARFGIVTLDFKNLTGDFDDSRKGSGYFRILKTYVFEIHLDHFLLVFDS